MDKNQQQSIPVQKSATTIPSSSAQGRILGSATSNTQQPPYTNQLEFKSLPHTPLGGKFDMKSALIQSKDGRMPQGSVTPSGQSLDMRGLPQQIDEHQRYNPIILQKEQNSMQGNGGGGVSSVLFQAKKEALTGFDSTYMKGGGSERQNGSVIRHRRIQSQFNTANLKVAQALNEGSIYQQNSAAVSPNQKLPQISTRKFEFQTQTQDGPPPLSNFFIQQENLKYSLARNNQSALGIHTSQIIDPKFDINSIGASRGALIHLKGSLKSNHRFVPDEALRNGGGQEESDMNSSKMPLIIQNFKAAGEISESMSQRPSHLIKTVVHESSKFPAPQQNASQIGQTKDENVSVLSRKRRSQSTQKQVQAQQIHLKFDYDQAEVTPSQQFLAFDRQDSQSPRDLPFSPGPSDQQAILENPIDLQELNDPFNYTRIEDNLGPLQNQGDQLTTSLPSDLSIDLDHDPEPSNVSDYDEQKERLKFISDADLPLQQEDSASPTNSAHSLTSDKLKHIEQQFSTSQKVIMFLRDNPVRQTFMRKQHGRLPYSVFRPHGSNIYFLKSIFDKRPPTAYFPYPKYCKTPREPGERLRTYPIEEVEQLFMSFQISDSTHIYNVLVNSLKYGGFELLDDSQYWNILWTRYVEASDVRKLNKYQKINHFPQSIQLSRKDYLWSCMYKTYQRFPKEFNITPMSYIFPEDYERFQQDREQEDPGVLYILKPVAASCGRGIKVIGKKTHISRRDGYLASKYVCKPHLINDLKYDLRVYVIVTSYDPLRVYVYNEGLVRFATEKYTLDPSDLKKKFVHLTNFSVNKKSANFKINNANGEDEESSSKWSFKTLKTAYAARGISYDFVFAQIKDVIVKTLISVEPQVVGALNQCPPGNRSSCFELYGFDVLIDENLKPWLLEVNVFPSLSSSSPFDKIVKSQLICDVFTLIGIRGYDKQRVHGASQEEETRQMMREPRKSLTIQQLLSSHRIFGQTESQILSIDEVNLLVEYEEEFTRKGQFSRVFPLAANVDYYEKFFEEKRYWNMVLWAYLRGGKDSKSIISRHYKRIYKNYL